MFGAYSYNGRQTEFHGILFTHTFKLGVNIRASEEAMQH